MALLIFTTTTPSVLLSSQSSSTSQASAFPASLCKYHCLTFFEWLLSDCNNLCIVSDFDLGVVLEKTFYRDLEFWVTLVNRYMVLKFGSFSRGFQFKVFELGFGFFEFWKFRCFRYVVSDGYLFCWFGCQKGKCEAFVNIFLLLVICKRCCLIFSNGCSVWVISVLFEILSSG